MLHRNQIATACGETRNQWRTHAFVRMHTLQHTKKTGVVRSGIRVKLIRCVGLFVVLWVGSGCWEQIPFVRTHLYARIRCNTKTGVVRSEIRVKSIRCVGLFVVLWVRMGVGDKFPGDIVSIPW